MISTRNLKELPDIDKLQKLYQSMAAIDMIFRRTNKYSEGEIHFDSLWDIDEKIAIRDNNQGAQLNIFFYKIGAIIIGFQAGCTMSPYNNDDKIWKGLIENVPDEFLSAVNSAHLEFDGIKHITYCIWKKYSDESWNIGEIDFPDDETDPDGSEYFYT